MYKRFSINKTSMCLLATMGLGLSSAHAASLSVSGGYTFDANMFNNYDLTGGVISGYGDTASYWDHRFILRPDVLVDDRFSIRSELNMLAQLSDSKNTVSSASGSALDGSLSSRDGQQVLEVRKVYLEWASDWGLFKIGRQPKDWGLGILFNTGSTPNAVNDTIVDRVGFEGMVGNLHLELGFEKGQEGKLANESDDVESYEMGVEYINEESNFDVGLLYNRTVALASSGKRNLAAHTLDIYSKKKFGALQLGGEFVSRGYESTEAQFGALGKILYKAAPWSLGLDVGYASANGSGNFAFQSNYQPLVILFNEYVGPKSGKIVRTLANVGNPIGQADGAGAFFSVLTGAYTFSSGNYTLGANYGYAQLAAARTNAGLGLGSEFDLYLVQKWYANFQTTYALGMLFPGKAFGPSSSLAWGTRIGGALAF